MRRKILVTILTSSVIGLLTSACGDQSTAAPPDTAPDAPPDTPPLPSFTINLDTDALPALVALRDGSGPWQTKTPASVLELEVHGPYQVAVVCEDEFGVTLFQVARTPDDERELFLPCGGVFPSQVEVTGKMVQAGSVALGFGSDVSKTANWNFSVFTDEGTHDIASFNASRLAVRRGVAINGATAITPNLDLNTQGKPLTLVPMKALNPNTGEALTTSIQLRTSNLTFVRVFNGPAATTKTVPASLLVSSDRQSVSVFGTTWSNNRSVRRARFLPGDSTEFTLPVPLGPVQFTVGTSLTVNWSTLPAFDLLEASLDASSEDFSTFFFHDLEISPSYVTATGATSLAIDTDIPGFKPEWRIDFTKEYGRSFRAVKFGTSDSSTSAFDEQVNSPTELVAIDRPSVGERHANLLERRRALAERRRQ